MNFWRSFAHAYEDLHRSIRPALALLAELSAIVCDGPSRTGHSPRDVLWARDDAHARAFELKQLFGLPHADEPPTAPRRRVERRPIVEASIADADEVQISRSFRTRERPREGLAEAVAAFDQFDLFTRASANNLTKTARISYELSGWAAAAVPITALLVLAYLLTRPPTPSPDLGAKFNALPRSTDASLVGSLDDTVSTQDVQLMPYSGTTTITVPEIERQFPPLLAPEAAKRAGPYKEQETAATPTPPYRQAEERRTPSEGITAEAPTTVRNTTTHKSVSRRGTSTSTGNRPPIKAIEPPVDWTIIE